MPKTLPRVPRVPRRVLGRRRYGVPVGDLLLSGFVLVIAVASVLAGKPDEGPMKVTLPVALVLCGALVWRTRAPLAAGIAATLAGLLQAAVAEQPGSLWALAVFLVLTYSVAAEHDEGAAALGGVVLVGGQMLMERFDNGVDYVFIVLVFGGAWLLGRGTREWRGRATYAEEHQRDLARLAVAEERVRIARELHDVVAHSLSVIAVQADAAEAALAHDAELAVEPLRAIRGSARDALAEMRQMLSVLRTQEEPDGPRRPAPGLTELPRLVEGMREAGLPVQATVEPGDQPLAPVVELAVYRIVQEGLTNVVKHAGRVATSLEVAGGDGRVEVRVANRPGVVAPPAGAQVGGHGLIGLRERVDSVGGSFRAGPCGDGGFEVYAVLPSQPHPPEATS